MTIGLSLPLGYLTGAEETADAKCFSEAFGKPYDCLAELKDHGVGSIELQGFGPDSPASSLLDVAQSILGSGISLTFHGYLPGNVAGPLFGDAYPQLLPTIDFLEDQQKETVMVVHAHADPHASYGAMVESTARALERLAESIHKCDLPVRVSLEINRYHGGQTPGATYDGLLEIAQHLECSEVGFCWDMGHTRSSVLQNRLPATPPPEFVKRVIHTHVHGLSPDGDTHRPLIESSLHVASGISQLRSFAYGGTYNLKLYPRRRGAEKTVRGEVLGSILCLREILNRQQGRIRQEN